MSTSYLWGREGEMQSEEVGFQSAFERGQRLGCSDVHRKVIPPSWGQNREQSWTSSAGVTGGGCQLKNILFELTDNSHTKFGTKWWTTTQPCFQRLSLWWMLVLYINLDNLTCYQLTANCETFQNIVTCNLFHLVLTLSLFLSVLQVSNSVVF